MPLKRGHLLINHPVAAALMSAHRIGWVSLSPGRFRTKDGINVDITADAPSTIRTLAERDVADYLLRNASAKNPAFQQYGPEAIPWLAPLRRAVLDPISDDWTHQHKALVRTRAARGLWSPAAIASINANFDGNCPTCGVLATDKHLDWCCYEDWGFRYQYGLDDSVSDACSEADLEALCRFCLVPDPTRSLPPPCSERWRWTVEPANGLYFGSSTFGDASTKPGVSTWTDRTAYCVAQLAGCGADLRVSACIVGTLPGPIQATPPGELYAFVRYLEFLRPGTRTAVYHSDCQWVVDGFSQGKSYTTGSGMTHADLWARLWRAEHSSSAHVSIIKVKGHATSVDVEKGYPTLYKDGNSCADAGAKLGLSLHDADPHASFTAHLDALVHFLAKYLARCRWRAIERDESCREASNIAASEDHSKTASTLQLTRHNASEFAPGDFRCLWCHRRAQTAEALERQPCSPASGHVLWIADPIIFCSVCASFSQERTHLLHGQCKPKATKAAAVMAKVRLKRIIEKGIHPVNDTPVGIPRLWRHEDPSACTIDWRHLDLLCSGNDSALTREPSERWRERIMDLCRHCNVKPSSDTGEEPSADAARYAYAIQPPQQVTARIQARWQPWLGSGPPSALDNVPSAPTVGKMRFGESARARFKLRSDALGTRGQASLSSVSGDLRSLNFAGEQAHVSAPIMSNDVTMALQPQIPGASSFAITPTPCPTTETVRITIFDDGGIEQLGGGSSSSVSLSSSVLPTAPSASVLDSTIGANDTPLGSSGLLNTGATLSASEKLAALRERVKQRSTQTQSETRDLTGTNDGGPQHQSLGVASTEAEAPPLKRRRTRSTTAAHAVAEDLLAPFDTETTDVPAPPSRTVLPAIAGESLGARLHRYARAASSAIPGVAATARNYTPRWRITGKQPQPAASSTSRSPGSFSTISSAVATAAGILLPRRADGPPADLAHPIGLEVAVSSNDGAICTESTPPRSLVCDVDVSPPADLAHVHGPAAHVTLNDVAAGVSVVPAESPSNVGADSDFQITTDAAPPSSLSRNSPSLPRRIWAWRLNAKTCVSPPDEHLPGP